MKRIIAAFLIAFAGGGFHSHNTTNDIPSECNYQRYYPGKATCHGRHWKISIAKECKTMWATYPDGLVKDDPVCAQWKPKGKR